MADWLGGYSAGWDVYAVDQETWADSAKVDGIMSVSIARDGTDDTPLLETGTMQADGEAPFEWSWCRVYMRAEQDGAESVPMATLLFERGKETTAHRSPITELRGRSVLQPVADRKLARGLYAASGIDGAAYAGRLLQACTPAPVVVEGSFTLVDDLVFDLGASYLSAVWQLVNAANWCVQIGGDGTIYVREKPTEPALELDRAHAGLLIPGVDMTLDLTEVPNRYIAVDNGKTAIAENDDVDLPASYARRGRWVETVDSSPTRIDGETLDGYAQRMLAEASTVVREYSYTREWWPEVMPYSLVRATLSEHGIQGDLRVVKQDLTCGKGVTVSETAWQEVRV